MLILTPNEPFNRTGFAQLIVNGCYSPPLFVYITDQQIILLQNKINSHHILLIRFYYLSLFMLTRVLFIGEFVIIYLSVPTIYYMLQSLDWRKNQLINYS